MKKINIMFRQRKIGFTLTEVLIVVIIIGILATLALPMLVKTLEKAKLGEAVSNLNLIRTGEKVYFLEYGQFWYTGSSSDGGIDSLNIENPNLEARRYFDYSITSADSADFTAQAERKEGTYTGKKCYINKSGAITADSDYLTP